MIESNCRHVQVLCQIDELRGQLGLALAADTELNPTGRRSKRVRGLQVEDEFTADDIADFERAQAIASQL